MKTVILKMDLLSCSLRMALSLAKVSSRMERNLESGSTFSTMALVDGNGSSKMANREGQAASMMKDRSMVFGSDTMLMANSGTKDVSNTAKRKELGKSIMKLAS